MVNAVRSLTRPVITILFAIAVTLFVGYDLIVNHVSVPLWYQVMSGGAVGYWFATRSKPIDKSQ